jgi:hypothetical protein
MLLIVAGLLSTIHPPVRGPVYAVAPVQAGLAEQPRVWVGRTVRVRGWAEACLAARGAPPRLSCARWPAYLVDADAAGVSGTVPLAWESQGAGWAFLRRLPWLRGLVPPPPTPRWNQPATYRVQLRAAVCGVAPCYEADVLDAAP